MEDHNPQPKTIFDLRRFNEAFSLLETFANEGDAGAQSTIGDCFFFGVGIEQDLAKAADYYRKAAEQGHAEAQNSLGGCFYHGRGVEQSFAKAAEWFHKASGHEDAAINYIAEIYLNKLRADGKIY